MVPTATQNSPPGRVPRVRAAAAPAPISTSPSSGQPRRLRTVPRRPARHGRDVSREACTAGANAAITAAAPPTARARAARASASRTGRDRRRSVRRSASRARRAAGRAARPTVAEPTPTSAACARTPRRMSRGVLPVAASRARSRRRRRTPTAKAGPASSTTSMTIETMTMTRTARVRPGRPRPWAAGSESSDEAAGGCSTTERERTTQSGLVESLHLGPRHRLVAHQQVRRVGRVVGGRSWSAPGRPRTPGGPCSTCPASV